MNQKTIMNFKEALEFLSLNKSTLYKLTSTKSIPHYKPSNGRIYFVKEELIEWITSEKKENIQSLENKFSNQKRIGKDGR